MSENEVLTEKDFEKEPAPEKKKKKNTKLRYAINITIVLVLTVAALLISLGSDFNESFRILGRCKWEWLVAMVGLMVLIACIRSFILFCFARLYTRNYKFYQALIVESIGNFYSAVTPGATGGEVMEAYMFKKQGIKISNAVSMLAMYSIVYQTVLTVFGLVSFGVKFEALNQIESVYINLGFIDFHVSIWLLTIIGFLLNVGVILLVFMMAFWKRFHRFIMGPMVSLATKVRLCRDPEKAREKLRVQVENFKIEFRRLWTNIPFTILVTVFFVALMMVRFSMPFFAGKALGNQGSGASWGTGLWDSIFLSNYHQMVTGLIPIPGSAGVSEYFFMELFVAKSDAANPQAAFYYLNEDGVNVSKQLCSSALLLWRTFTFTLPLIIAGFVTAFYRAAPHDIDKEEGEAPSRETFFEAQRQTLMDRETSLNETMHTKSLSRKAIMDRLKQLDKKKKPSKKKSSSSKSSASKKQVEEEDPGYTSLNIDSSEDDE